MFSTHLAAAEPYPSWIHRYSRYQFLSVAYARSSGFAVLGYTPFTVHVALRGLRIGVITVSSTLPTKIGKGLHCLPKGRIRRRSWFPYYIDVQELHN